MTAHAWILAILGYLGLNAMGAVPFQQQTMNQALAYLIPFVPWIIFALILRGVVGTAVSWIDRLFAAIGAIVYGVAFTIIVVPVMVADTFLLGPIAMWAWKQTSILVLSVVVNGFVYWFLTTTPLAIPKKYIAGALVLNVSMIFVLYSSQWLLNTHWIEFKAKGNVFLPNPVVSVEVKAGDTIRFVALGYNVVAKTPGGVVVHEIYPPEGLPDELYPDPAHPGWNRPDGEIQLLVTRPDGTKTVVLVQDIETGPGEIFGFYFKDIAGGYYVSGKAEIPERVQPGRLGVEFFNIRPIDGKLRMTLIHNLGKSPLGRFTEAFVLGQGLKGLKKQDFQTGLWWFTLGLCFFTVVGGSILAWHSQVGVLSRLPDIIFWTLALLAIWYAVDQMAFANKGLFTLLKTVWGWVKS